VARPVLVLQHNTTQKPLGEQFQRSV
jgi:hypothetical protein